jgi:hypothetical protein
MVRLLASLVAVLRQRRSTGRCLRPRSRSRGRSGLRKVILLLAQQAQQTSRQGQKMT